MNEPFELSKDQVIRRFPKGIFLGHRTSGLRRLGPQMGPSVHFHHKPSPRLTLLQLSQTL